MFYRKQGLIHKKLEYLDASDCNLKEAGLNNLPRLKFAKLSRNQISIFPDVHYSNMLQSLDLAYNNLKDLSRISITNLPKLRKLDLSGNFYCFFNLMIFLKF